MSVRVPPGAADGEASRGDGQVANEHIKNVQRHLSLRDAYYNDINMYILECLK